jgi:hypothetical protein
VHLGSFPNIAHTGKHTKPNTLLTAAVGAAATGAAAAVAVAAAGAGDTLAGMGDPKLKLNAGVALGAAGVDPGAGTPNTDARALHTCTW